MPRKRGRKKTIRPIWNEQRKETMLERHCVWLIFRSLGLLTYAALFLGREQVIRRALLHM